MGLCPRLGTSSSGGGTCRRTAAAAARSFSVQRDLQTRPFVFPNSLLKIKFFILGVFHVELKDTVTQWRAIGIQSKLTRAVSRNAPSGSCMLSVKAVCMKDVSFCIVYDTQSLEITSAFLGRDCGTLINYGILKKCSAAIKENETDFCVLF